MIYYTMTGPLLTKLVSMSLVIRKPVIKMFCIRYQPACAPIETDYRPEISIRGIVLYRQQTTKLPIRMYTGMCWLICTVAVHTLNITGFRMSSIIIPNNRGVYYIWHKLIFQELIFHNFSYPYKPGPLFSFGQR